MIAKPEAREAILTLLAAHGGAKTICPSEAARAIGGAEWRETMPAVHAAACMLAEEGVAELRQRGVRCEAGAIVGPYRIADLR